MSQWFNYPKFKQSMLIKKREIPYDRSKIVFVTNIDIRNRNDQNRLKFFIKRSKYTLIPLRLINLDIKV